MASSKLVLAVGRRPQFLSTALLEYPHDMASGFFRASNLREQGPGGGYRFNDLTSEDTLQQFHLIPFVPKSD